MCLDIHYQANKNSHPCNRGTNHHGMYCLEKNKKYSQLTFSNSEMLTVCSPKIEKITDKKIKKLMYKYLCLLYNW